jgi:hypothetical protein
MAGERGFEGRATFDDDATYQIAVQGRLDERWAGWFDGLAPRLERGPGGQPVTILEGPVADQAALRGILNRIWDLHLTIISVTRTDVDGT